MLYNETAKSIEENFKVYFK